jgi:hypothetical protein
MGSKLRVAYSSYKAPFYAAAILAGVALLAELMARRPAKQS